MKKIAICIDDDELSLFLLKKELENNGFEVFEAIDYELGLKIIQKKLQIKYVFLDHKFSKMNDYSFLKLISEDVHYSSLRVIIMLSNESEHFLDKATESQVNIAQVVALINKPIGPKKIGQLMSILR